MRCRPCSRTSTSPTSRRTRRCLDTAGCASPSSSTRSFTGRSRSETTSRICRRRASATALNAPAVVAARAMAGRYMPISLYVKPTARSPSRRWPASGRDALGRVGGPPALEPAVLVRPSLGSGWVQARQGARDPLVELDGGVEEHRDLLRGEQRSREQEDVPVRLGGDAVGQGEEPLHQALLEEREGEPLVLGLDPEPPVEPLELEPHLRQAENGSRVVGEIPRGDPEPRDRCRERHHRTREPPPRRGRMLLRRLLVPEVEDADLGP